MHGDPQTGAGQSLLPASCRQAARVTD
ncbi:protein of unknown function [Cupriavidus taiwanensis]|nr:protein of unknown function [Cupriavidus taiwanensis]